MTLRDVEEEAVHDVVERAELSWLEAAGGDRPIFSLVTLVATFLVLLFLLSIFPSLSSLAVVLVHRLLLPLPLPLTFPFPRSLPLRLCAPALRRCRHRRRPPHSRWAPTLLLLPLRATRRRRINLPQLTIHKLLQL